MFDLILGTKKNLKKHKDLIPKVEKTLKDLTFDPYLPHLKTHQVKTKRFGTVKSSRVNGDIRILWNFNEEDNLIILLLDIGGQSGSRNVYREPQTIYHY